MKKIISSLMAALMIFGMLAGSASAQEIKEDDSYSLGDVDGTGSVNAMDSLALRVSLAGAGDSAIDIECADFDGDGKLSGMDSYYMKACLAGKIAMAELEGDHNVYRLVIGGYDITEFCIVVPEGATEKDNVHYAAEAFLPFFLGQYKITIESRILFEQNIICDLFIQKEYEFPC